MENQLLNLLEKAKTNRTTLKHLKEAAFSALDHTLYADLLNLETELFPESPEQRAAKEQGARLELLFRMVGLEGNEAGCWLVAETLKVYAKRKGRFDLLDAAKLKEKKAELFGE